MSDHRDQVTGPAPRRGLSRYAKFLAGYTLLLIVAGALVTGNNASLSDSTWPHFAGNVLPKKETFVRGLIYEDSHRIIAGFFGILVLILAGWVTIADPRKWIKALGWGIVAATVTQGLIGGGIIHLERPPLVSMAHGFLGQTLFVGVTLMALATSPRWNEWWGTAAGQPGGTALRATCLVATLIAFAQLFLGTATRFSGEHFLVPVIIHAVMAFIVTSAAVWLWLLIGHRHKNLTSMVHLSHVLLGLIACQFLLGVTAIMANRTRYALELKGPIPEAQFGHELEAPPMWMAVTSTMHVAVGALILVCFAILTIRAFQYYGSPATPAARQAGRQPLPAGSAA